jgi:hypothetical protein
MIRLCHNITSSSTMNRLHDGSNCLKHAQTCKTHAHSDTCYAAIQSPEFDREL